MNKNFRLFGLIIAAFAFCFYLQAVPAHAAYDADGNKIESGDSEGVKESDSNEPPAAEKEDSGDQAPAIKPSAKKLPKSPPSPANSKADNPAKAPAVPAAAAPPEKAPAEVIAPNPAPSEAPEPAPAKGSWWKPKPGTKWQIQYAGALDTSFKVAAYDVDLFDIDPGTIDALHKRGIKVICYFSAGSYEKWRPDADKFPQSILGKPNGWKDEKWLDIRRLDILKPVMEGRINMAAQKKCDAIDPDNVEAFENKSGFPLTGRDQIAFNKMLADLGHAKGMAVGLKNDLSQVTELLDHFDFQVNEQCFEYQSCDDLAPFIRAGKPVFNIEYKEAANQFCSQANEMNFDSLKKNLALDAKVEFCR